ncbi:MAG: Rieske (2Fe-2S) protein [Deltaproteobacteria bacterium]|nr:MAG: Rieske (2Fe-2S) protein [Deltaproteobacteria bacterium]
MERCRGEHSVDVPVPPLTRNVKGRIRLPGSHEGRWPVDEWKRVLHGDRVTQDRMARGFAGTRPVVVVRVGEQLRAFRDRCPHAGAPLSGGDLSDGRVRCPRHGWSFDVSGGTCAAHPDYSLRLLEVRERDGWIEVLDPEVF